MLTTRTDTIVSVCLWKYLQPCANTVRAYALAQGCRRSALFQRQTSCTEVGFQSLTCMHQAWWYCTQDWRRWFQDICFNRFLCKSLWVFLQLHSHYSFLDILLMLPHTCHFVKYKKTTVLVYRTRVYLSSGIRLRCYCTQRKYEGLWHHQS
jgi:hypothetical protein